jgi:DNA (cytosine-5)-methyltransferase 1
MAFNVFSCFSGIEAATVAFEPLGFKTVGLSEVDPFCCELLKQKIPGTLNFGDIKKHREWKLPRSIDFCVGGPPCQSWSIGGLRKGMEDPRGNLSLTYLSFLDRVRPRWVLIENVLGLLSSNNGQDFGTILGGLAQLRYGFAYAVLDAQHFGVPQRRRRVFIVGHSGGDWKRAGAVLFNSESVFGNLEESRKKRRELKRKTQRSPQDGITGAICADTHPGCYSGQDAYQNRLIPEDKVRRLTPVECERLQGFPDHWTRIAYRNKPPELCPDGPRYKAIGNSWAVPVVRWIGERIKEVDQW